jgi:hypothetical protein
MCADLLCAAPGLSAKSVATWVIGARDGYTDDTDVAGLHRSDP